jgi:hypothetical protein
MRCDVFGVHTSVRDKCGFQLPAAVLEEPPQTDSARPTAVLWAQLLGSLLIRKSPDSGRLLALENFSVRVSWS